MTYFSFRIALTRSCCSSDNVGKFLAVFVWNLSFWWSCSASCWSDFNDRDIEFISSLKAISAVERSGNRCCTSLITVDTLKLTNISYWLEQFKFKCAVYRVRLQLKGSYTGKYLREKCEITDQHVNVSNCSPPIYSHSSCLSEIVKTQESLSLECGPTNRCLSSCWRFDIRLDLSLSFSPSSASSDTVCWSSVNSLLCWLCCSWSTHGFYRLTEE